MPALTGIIGPSLDTDVVEFSSSTPQEKFKVFVNPSEKLLGQIFSENTAFDLKFFREYFHFDEEFNFVKNNGLWAKTIVAFADDENMDKAPWNVKITSSINHHFLRFNKTTSRVSKENAIDFIQSECQSTVTPNLSRTSQPLDVMRFSFDHSAHLRITIDVTVWKTSSKETHCFINMAVVGCQKDIVNFQKQYNIKKWDGWSKMNFFIATELPELFEELQKQKRLFPITQDQLKSLRFPSRIVLQELMGRAFYVPFVPNVDSGALDIFLNQFIAEETCETLEELVNTLVRRETWEDFGLFYYVKYVFYYLTMVKPSNFTQAYYDSIWQLSKTCNDIRQQKLWAELLFPVAIEEEFTALNDLLANPHCQLLLLLSANFGNAAARYFCQVFRNSELNFPKIRTSELESQYSSIFCTFDEKQWVTLELPKTHRRRAQYWYKRSSFVDLSSVSVEFEKLRQSPSPFVDLYFSPLEVTEKVEYYSALLMKYPRHPVVRRRMAIAYKMAKKLSMMRREFEWAVRLGDTSRNPELPQPDEQALKMVETAFANLAK